VIVVFVSLYTLGSAQVYLDWGLVCENTGSTKGHREWRFEKNTGHWYKKSVLEDFMLKEYPDRLKHRWTSYAGTGKNIFGQVLSRHHGMPGAIYGIKSFLKDWVQKNEPEDILALYELLASDVDNEIKKQRIEEIVDEYLSAYLN
jgi:hypothetical protein